MKKINLLLTMLFPLLFSTLLHADAKRYNIRSGIVTYKIEGKGSFLGFSTKTTGEEKLYFTEWGNIELREIDEQEVSMGKTTLTHNIIKINHGTVYSVDEKRKRIIKQDIAMLKKMDNQGKNMSAMGKEMMQQMGGKKVGTGKVLGYPCEIWELMGSRIWMYKGVALKTEANIMGFRHLQIATSAKFNIPVPKSKLKLPDYPVKTLDTMIGEELQKREQSPAQKSTPASQQPTPEQMKQMQDMLQNLGKMFGQQ